MKTRSILSAAFTLLFISIATQSFAQPGGPGGRPMGPPPGGRPMGPPPSMRGDRPGMPNDSKASTVKQKKRVTDGTTFKVVGSLRDSVTGEALPYVNIAILERSDSSMVKGGVTNIDGYFEVTEVPAGDYYARISAIGYQTTYVPISVSNNTALGTIRVKPGSMSLKEVTVVADRPLYAMDGEKMIYNVSEDPSIQTGTTSDALQNAPGVEVDIEGNVTLRGVSSVEIWVNDKPSKLTEENLKTYLETLPANALARIETITNPSAKYATEAEAVINIVTSAHIKSNQFVSFGVNAASQPNVSPWLTYTWAKERLSINAFASGRFSQRESIGNNWSISRKDNADLSGFDTIMRQIDSSTTTHERAGGNFSLNIDYEIDSMTDISLWGHASLNSSQTTSDSWILRDQSYSGGNIYEYTTFGDTRNTSFFGIYGADYSKKFDKNGHNLRISLFGNNSINNQYSQYDRVYKQTDDNPLNQTYYKYGKYPSRDNTIELSARYNRPYSADGEMSYGLSIDHENSHSDYRPYLLDTAYRSGITILDTALYDALRRYTLNENSNSVEGDVNWQHRWGGFTLELGLGAALSNDHFAYTETAMADDTAYLWFTTNPSIHLSYRTESMHNFKLNYSMRMRNPNTSNLTTFKKYSEDSYSTGNRHLHQSYTHNAELGWTKFFERFGNIGIEGYGRLSTGQVDNLTDVTDDIDEYIGRIINYSMPYNIGTSWRYGVSANMTYRPTGFFNLRLYANLYDYGYSMQYDKLGETVTENKWSYSIRMNLWAKIWNKYQIHASANYSSPTIGLMSTRSARYFVNCGVRADFFKRKLSAFINVQDIFNWGRKIGNGSGNTNPYYLSSNNSYTTNSRYISAGITLRFGKMELEHSSKSGSEAGGASSTLSE